MSSSRRRGRSATAWERPSRSPPDLVFDPGGSLRIGRLSFSLPPRFREGFVRREDSWDDFSSASLLAPSAGAGLAVLGDH